MLATRIWIVFLLIAAVIVTSGFRKSSFRNGESIMAELKDRQITTSEVELLNMSVIDESGNVEVREFISVIKPDADGNLRYLVRFLSPEAIRGVTLLTIEQPGGGNDQYLYLPAMGQARQITGDQQSGTFMGSDFSFNDLSKENPKDHQYYRLIDGEHEGQEVYIIMSAPEGVDIYDRSDYPSRLMYIDKENYNILKVEFYDEGRTSPTKVLMAFDYASPEIDGSSQRPRRAVMNNKISDTTSIITLLRSRLDQAIPEEIFLVETIESWESDDDKTLLALFETAPTQD